MTYIVIELQTSNGVTAVVPPAAYTDRNAAEQAFHLALASAAVSQMETHAVSMLTQDGKLLNYGVYYHPKQEPESEEPAE